MSDNYLLYEWIFFQELIDYCDNAILCMLTDINAIAHNKSTPLSAAFSSALKAGYLNVESDVQG